MCSFVRHGPAPVPGVCSFGFSQLVSGRLFPHSLRGRMSCRSWFHQYEVVSECRVLFFGVCVCGRITPAIVAIKKKPCEFLLLCFGCAGSWLLVGSPLVALRASHRSGFSSRAQALGRARSILVAHGLRCPSACGVFLDQGSSLCPLRWQAGSLPLDHRGSALPTFT